MQSNQERLDEVKHKLHKLIDEEINLDLNNHTIPVVKKRIENIIDDEILIIIQCELSSKKEDMIHNYIDEINLKSAALDDFNTKIKYKLNKVIKVIDIFLKNIDKPLDYLRHNFYFLKGGIHKYEENIKRYNEEVLKKSDNFSIKTLNLLYSYYFDYIHKVIGISNKETYFKEICVSILNIKNIFKKINKLNTDKQNLIYLNDIKTLLPKNISYIIYDILHVTSDRLSINNYLSDITDIVEPLLGDITNNDDIDYVIVGNSMPVLGG